MQFSNKIYHYFVITSLLLLASSQVRASVIQLTPPTSLNIDGQNISEGVFTLKSFSGIESNLNETEILSLANPGDDITHNAVIGSGSSHELLSYPEFYPILKFTYSFDATQPDLPEIMSNVISASNVFTISLPLVSTTTGFFEVIDFNGNATFHTTAAVLDTAASGATNIDLLGDQSVFATFGIANTQLSNASFQAHGTIVVPTPNSALLFVFGLFVLFRKQTKIKL